MCDSKFLFRYSSCKMKIFFGFVSRNLENPRIREPRTGMSKATLRETKSKTRKWIIKFINKKIKKKNNNHTNLAVAPSKARANPCGQGKTKRNCITLLSARNKWFTSRNLRFTFTYNFLSQVILPLSFIMSNRKTLQIWFSLSVDYTFICFSKL